MTTDRCPNYRKTITSRAGTTMCENGRYYAENTLLKLNYNVFLLLGMKSADIARNEAGCYYKFKVRAGRLTSCSREDLLTLSQGHTSLVWQFK